MSASGKPSFDIPRNRVLPVGSIAVRLDDQPHPYQLENAAEIEENWQLEIRRNPDLFDGKVAMLSHLRYSAGRIVGVCHSIRFATFLKWRKDRFAGKGFHFFANAIPVCRDGGLIAVKMGRHTANAGRVYFAAGSFEPADFRDGYADIDFNMRREVAEETGIDLAPLVRDRNYHVLCTAAGLTLVRRYYLEADAKTVVRQVREYISSDSTPEIDDVIAIYNEAGIPDTAPVHMLPLVRWHFSGTGESCQLEKQP